MKYINLLIILITGILFIIILNSSFKSGYEINILVCFITMIVFIYVYKSEKRRDEYIKKIKEQNQNILQTQKIAKLGMWRFEEEESKLIWDDETYKIFDVDKKQKVITLEDFYEALHPNDIKDVIRNYENHIRTKIKFTTRFRLKTKVGNIKYVEQRCETIFDENSNPLVSFGTIQDRTEKAKVDIAIKEKDFLLIKSNRMAQMGEMINMIAHQWRQPLNSISLTVSNLQLKCMLDEVDKDLFKQELELVNRYSQHLSKTINDFRNFFKENKTKEMTNLKSLIQNTLDIVQKSIENKNIKIVTYYSCDIYIETYPNEVMQVILNIIKNAEDILLEKNIQNAKIEIQAICEGNREKPTIFIRDNAGGIPLNIIDKIFDIYFSTKLKKDGTGLGLYMSKTIIEEHCGGKLSVENDRYGAIFKIEFDKKA